VADDNRSGRLTPTAWLVCSVGLWLAALVSVTASVPDGAREFPIDAVPATSSAITDQTAPASQAKYVGQDVCVTCHDTQRQKYATSAHHHSMDPRTPAAKQSCETCHGPGSEHAEDPVNKHLKDFKKLPAAEINATCTTCHSRGEHTLWEGSQHESRGLACTTCHSVHSFKGVPQIKEKTQLELCANCHRDKVSKVDRSGHMPVRENKMQCTTCHNVHGATNVKLLRKGDSIAGLCTSCHADKRGPYLWEHPPSRDGCVTCHDPHGSANERMLVAKTPLLCQRCHAGTRHPSTIYDAALVGSGASPSVRIYGRSCVECHSAIHGSNHPSGQRFIR